ncbi:protein suppressor of sable isoform X2 [Ceratitis capitata]|uniref:protein suppressor of sable isoform X2 n=1 Tax=Ceratitis capitata TaxID=7213 RepID=UPI000329EB2A|nr:protein suppressor of sable isoform X2 [Ceratitis capitata]
MRYVKMSEESNNTVICDTNITTTSTMSTTEPEKETAAIGTVVSTKPADTDTTVETVDIEDLEDGEIDEDDEDDDVVVTGATTSTNQANTSTKSTTKSTNDASSTSKTINDVTVKIPIIDLSHDHTPSPTSVSNSKTSESKSRRSKKGQPPTDDYMEEVEKSLSIILMKAGKEPQLPKCLEARQQQEPKEADSTVSQSRSSRRRKRRKQREEREKEKDKERKDKEKTRFHSPEPYNGAPPLEDDEDDFEMLNVVGGSPSSTPVPKYAPSAYPIYDSAEESYTSYDSCDSLDGERGGGSESKRRRRRNKKERKRGRDRERRARSREDSARGGGPSEKRSRRDSNDDKHRQEPRKLELCKFYLMECCAKKDKCSYMHSDFPCKYYYLGMECPNIETCKFMHEAPLSEQLRNILLKHLETAPKEILGNFKRISRDNAIAMMTKRNEELCKEYKVENTWAPIVNIATNNNRRGGHQAGGGAVGNMLNDQQQQQHQQQKQHNQQQQQQQHQQPHSNIPSLFDIVVKPPVSLLSVGDKHRKSRWTDSPTREEPTTTTQENNTNSFPSYLDLKNLEGIMKAEHIQKLTTLGITNLQEINQFTFGQLQKIGIDFVEISEVQKRVQSRMENKAETEEEPKIATTTAYSEPISMTTTTSASSLCHNPTTDGDSNSNNSTGVVRFEYSQYLKDSNLAFDRCDAYDDERDEEQLVIDDPNMEHEENPRTTTSTSNENDNVHDEPPKTSDLASRLGLHLNPFNPFRTNPGDFLKNEHKSNTNNASSSGFQYNEHKRTRGRSRSRSHSRSRSRSRSRSHTPTRTQSITPEASDSADNDDGDGGTTKAKQPIYERKTMYDFDAVQAQEDERKLSERSDKDMRYVPGSNSMLPFQAVTNYTPATEIDAAMSSHLPMTYKVHEFDMPPANYADLRRNLRATTNTADPRVRRILGLPETRATSVALKRAGRKLSNTIASPEADDTPKYYTPPALSSTQSTTNASERERRIEERRSSISKTASPTVSSSRTDPRLDPRCAASSAATAAAAKASEADKTSSATASASGTAGDSINARITDLGKKMRENMQNSDWYRKLNSNMKIQYNQELARLITELRRFHQDTSPDKNFNFINCNKKIIDDILIQLGIFIDENGEVNKIELDKPDDSELNMNAEARGDYMQQLDFPNPQLNMPNAGYRNPIDFRFPPPALGGGLAGPRLPPIAVAAAAAAAAAAAGGGMPPGGLAGVFNNNNNNMPQQSLLGMPPLFHQFNAGGGNFAPTGSQMAFGFLNFPQQMGGGGGGGGGGPRNFNMDGGQHNRRNPNNRRHFI